MNSYECNCIFSGRCPACQCDEHPDCRARASGWPRDFGARGRREKGQDQIRLQQQPLRHVGLAPRPCRAPRQRLHRVSSARMRASGVDEAASSRSPCPAPRTQMIASAGGRPLALADYRRCQCQPHWFGSRHKRNLVLCPKADPRCAARSRPVAPPSGHWTWPGSGRSIATAGSSTVALLVSSVSIPLALLRFCQEITKFQIGWQPPASRCFRGCTISKWGALLNGAADLDAVEPGLHSAVRSPAEIRDRLADFGDVHRKRHRRGHADDPAFATAFGRGFKTEHAAQVTTGSSA